MVSGHLNGKPMKTLQSSQPRLGANEPSSLISIQVGILSKYFPAADDGVFRDTTRRKETGTRATTL